MEQAIYFNGDHQSLIILHKYGNNSINFCINTEEYSTEIVEYLDFITYTFDIKIEKFPNVFEALSSLKDRNINTILLSDYNTDIGYQNKQEYESTNKKLPNMILWYPLITWTDIEVLQYVDINMINFSKLVTNKAINFILSDNEYPTNCLCKAVSSGGFGRRFRYPYMNLNANFDIDYGIYYGKINQLNNGIKYNMMIYYYDDNEPIEMFILQSTREYFYDRIVNVSLLGFIRPTRLFKTVTELTEAIENDIKMALLRLEKF